MGLHFAPRDDAFGFRSHVIVRRSPAGVWGLLRDPGAWNRIGGEFAASGGSDVFAVGAKFRIGPRLPGLPARLAPRAAVLVAEENDEVVWEGDYFGAPVRHGLRFDPYWHDDEDEDAPAPSCRIVHSLACFGTPGRLLMSTGAMKELEDRFHRFNQALAAHCEAT